ncbi:hypothetical protein VTH82DRAFT_4718 [Thermothelomyces myriococcoides]
MPDDYAPADGTAAGGAVSPFAEQQQYHGQPPNARNGGPGPQVHPPPPRFQSKHQQHWPGFRPWRRHGDADAADTLGHHAHHHQFFRRQKTPPPGNRSPRFPVLQLRSEAHVSPDLVSPRSDSFFYNSRPARPCPSPTPTVSHFPSGENNGNNNNYYNNNSNNRMRAESTPTQRLPPRSVFPGLSSNPFIPESPESEASPVESSPGEPRRFLLFNRHHDQIARSDRDYSMEASDESRQGTPTEPSVVVENFSRPRRTSVRSQQSDGALARHMAAPRLYTDPHHPVQPPPPQSSSPHAPAPTIHPVLNPSPLSRQPSESSSRTASTISSIPPYSSHDPSDISPRSYPSRVPTPGVIAPTPTPTSPRSPRAQHNYNGPQQYLREVPPWLTTGNEVRSSFRSQLTSSTAQATLFTAGGTDRNSIVTKASSITEQSIINGYARRSWRAGSVDDGPSLEDVMGMYERGFNDSDIESVRRSMRFPDDDDVPDTDHEMEMPEMGGSRPTSSHSGASDLGEKMLEAMNDTLPPPPAMSIPESDRSIGRRSRTRRSMLPSSLPDSVGFGLASEYASRREKTRSDATEKHDSGKLVDDDGGDTGFSKETGGNTVFSKETGDDTGFSKETGEDPGFCKETGPQSPTPSTPTSPAQAQPDPTADVPSPNPPMQAATAAPIPQEPPEDPDSRDRYGFRKASANVTRQEYDAWNKTYTEYLARRRKKWIAFLKDNSLMTDRPNRFPPRSAKTKRFIRKGIPPDWRGAAWFYYAGGPAILSKHRGVYDQLVQRAGLNHNNPGPPSRPSELKPVIVEDIEKDLYRTFPDNVRFKPPPPPPGTYPPGQSPPEPEIITSLRRVLHAFAIYNPRIGYCQSLNFLAGLLLLFVETEEHAFWLLNVITRVYLPGTHEMSLEGSKIDLGVLMAALKESLPGVWKQIGGDEFEAGKKGKVRRGQKSGHVANSASVSDPNRLPAITLCMTAWFMSCFIGTLPIETTLRVWDVFFYEGSRTLFRIALTIFKLGEREIKAVKDPMEMFGVVQTFPRRIVDCNMLLETCYKRRNGIAHLTQELVEERRKERREGIRRWKAEQEAAASEQSSPKATRQQQQNQQQQRLGTTATVTALGLDLATDPEDVRRRAPLFGRRKDREQIRAAEVV